MHATPKTAIIGAGISGLTSAKNLADAPESNTTASSPPTASEATAEFAVDGGWSAGEPSPIFVPPGAQLPDLAPQDA
nr:MULTISPECIES: hypothetical protein [unclassified Mycobacterium]